MLDDEDSVDYELAVSDDDRIYRLTVKCGQEMSREEYAICLRALAQDILDGRLTDISLASDLN